jgi:pSer/pThr/pTyr-binding forkhead associated (FHA) protein
MSAELKGSQGNIALSLFITKVGRAQENQLILNDTDVSWLHAQILQQAQGHSVIDLGSTNGTFVNEQKLAPNNPRLLYVGDTIRFGNTVFTYANTSVQYSPTRAVSPSYASPPPYTPAPAPSPVLAPFAPAAPGRFQQEAAPLKPLAKKDSSDGGTPRWIIIVGGLASLATIFGVIFGMYTYAHPSPSSSTTVPGVSTAGVSTTTSAPSIPQLHNSYTGELTHSNGAANTPFTIFSLTEDDQGNFNASGNDGGSEGQCSTTYKGLIHADGSIAFTVTEAAGQECGVIAQLTGTLLPNQSFQGTWVGLGIFEQLGGSWTMQ